MDAVNEDEQLFYDTLLNVVGLTQAQATFIRNQGIR